MKQQINLYQVGLTASWQWFSLQQVLLLTVMTAIILLSLSLYDSYQNQTLNKEIQRLSKQRRTLQHEVDVFIARLPEDSVNEILKQEVEHLEKQYTASQQLHHLVNDKHLGNTTGFAGYLRSFARQTVSGLWLSKIDLQSGGANMRLSGYSQDAAFIPRFLQNLKQEALLSKKQFKQLKLEKQSKKESKVYFLLDTQPHSDTIKETL